MLPVEAILMQFLLPVSLSHLPIFVPFSLVCQAILGYCYRSNADTEGFVVNQRNEAEEFKHMPGTSPKLNWSDDLLIFVIC